VADAGAAPRRPMVREHEPDPIPATAPSEAMEPEDPYFALVRQREWEDEQERKARRRNRGGSQIRPEDFGL
jgi:hypothetical protein